MKNLQLVVVDVEADGPCPALFSMVCFGAVIVNQRVLDGNPAMGLWKTAPVSPRFDPEALAISGYTREEHEKFLDPGASMRMFQQWLSSQCKGNKPVFISDNNGFDWQFINFYFHRSFIENPFGFSSLNLNCLWKGKHGTLKASWKRDKSILSKLKTEHDHNPMHDALRMAEALMQMGIEL